MEYNITDSPVELLDELLTLIQDSNFTKEAHSSLTRGELKSGVSFRRRLRRISQLCSLLRKESLKTSSRNREPF